MQVRDRKGRNQDRQVRDELLLGRQADTGVAPRRLHVSGVWQATSEQQEDRRSGTRRRRLGQAGPRGQKAHPGQDRGAREIL